MNKSDDLNRMTNEEWGSAVAWSEFDYDDPAEDEEFH